MDARVNSVEFDGMPVDELCINTIRTLAMDAVQAANSGHPGTPMALAPAGFVLWNRLLRHNPKNPNWFNRDRFVLSAGHASMLLYSLLHLTGYDLSLDEIRNFRQWGSKTPGHPEHARTPGVETTTGPLGQGFLNGVGLAMAEAHLAAVFNRNGCEIVDHHTYVFCSDGDLMEGASHEGASLAGHLGLGKLIVLYDDNHITIEGNTSLAFSEDIQGRFESYRWHVQNLGEAAGELAILENAFRLAQSDSRPSLIIVRSHIAYGAPHAVDTAAAHGAPLGESEVRAAKTGFGWPDEPKFLVPERAVSFMRQAIARGEKLESGWNRKLQAYRRAYPELASRFDCALAGELPSGWEKGVPVFSPDDGPMATRAASGKVLNAIFDNIPSLMGGAADLAPSTNTLIKRAGDFAKGQHQNRNIHFGVREHAMCGALNGLALHGGVRPYGATFLIFSDYARPAIRLAAMMRLPVIYVMTHDSIGLGEDGPTHQSVEQLASLRALPNLCLIRPGDANEAAHAWRVALTRRGGPTMLVLSRQALPILDRSGFGDAAGVSKGGYILASEKGEAPQLILLASGSEVPLMMSAWRQLQQQGIDSRAVSFPSWDLFRSQPESYRNLVLPPEVGARLAIEAAATLGWCEWVKQGDMIGIDRFGASAPSEQNMTRFGFSVDHVVARAKSLLEQSR